MFTKGHKLTITLLAALLIGAVAILVVITQQKNDGSIASGIVHYPTLLSQKYYDDAFEAAPAPIPAPTDTYGGTVSHHLLAAPLIAQFFNGLADTHPKTVIIVGPDHLNRGHQAITTTLGTWRTAYGDLLPDRATEKVVTDGGATVEEKPFDYEHSIGALVPFVKRVFPEARAVSIILRADATSAQVEKLLKALPSGNGTLLIVSEDFSHYLPSAVAQFHDAMSRRVLETLDTSAIDTLETDVKPPLTLGLEYFKQHGAERFTLVDETDSGRMTGHTEVDQTTSYIMSYYSKSDVITSEPISTVLNTGEIATIVSPEDRFLQGFDRRATERNRSLPRLGDYGDGTGLAAGTVVNSQETDTSLFPLKQTKGVWSLMPAADWTAFFAKHRLSATIKTSY